jgi:periplasmic protein TonB
VIESDTRFDALPTGPPLRRAPDGTLRAERLPLEPPSDRHAKWRHAVALLAALLVHLAAVAPLIDKLPPVTPPQAQPIPVELAYEPPKPPAPPVPPVEKPPAQQQQPMPPRQSGGELEHVPPGTIPPATEAAKQPPAEAAPAPPVAETPPPPAMPALPDEPSQQSQSVPLPTPGPDAPQAMSAPPVPTEKPTVPATHSVEAAPPAEPQTAVTSPDTFSEPGQGGGDRYLNAIRATVLQHFVYPPTAELFHIVGVAKYEIVIDRKGELLDVHLVTSARSAVLDNAGLRAIRMSAPFGPVPDDFLDETMALILDFYMGPER